MPLIVSNFIALGQTMYEKRFTILQYFGVLRDPCVKVYQSGHRGIQQGPKGATTGGLGVRTPKNLDGPPQLFDEECDYRYVTDCSPRNWVCHLYFVMYNNLDQGIGPQLCKRGCAPEAPVYQAAKYRPLLITPLRDICWQSSSISLMS